LETAAVIVALVACAVVLTRPAVGASDTWRATVTPLASIIGSGFLVLAPLLADTAGEWAPVAILGIVLLAYAIGGALRYNILHLEPILAEPSPPAKLHDLERVSRFALGIAYMISVAFYLRLLASFLLDAVGAESATNGRILTTGILAGIGVLGLLRGLHGIEAVEIPAVDLKLVVIAALLAGMLVFDVRHGSSTVHAFGDHPVRQDGVTVLRRLGGMLLVVQGFETSRYLGHYYPPRLRARTMRNAQVLSGTIYVGFALLVVPFFGRLGSGPRETAILDAARIVSPVLVPLLILAAVASQLSAATADTAGGSEMLTSRPRHEGRNIGYPAVALGATFVAWFADIFSIVSFASRAFALYYACQATLAAMTALRLRPPRYGLIVAANIALAVGLLVVAFVAIPGDSSA
jgi:hypothetical protein